MRRLLSMYPRIWPFVFLAGGVVSSIWGGHLHFTLLGEARMVNLHTLMWFLMALAHMDVFWRGRNGGKPSPPAD